MSAQRLVEAERSVYKKADRGGATNAGPDPDPDDPVEIVKDMPEISTPAPARKPPTPKKPDDWTPLGDVAAEILRRLRERMDERSAETTVEDHP